MSSASVNSLNDLYPLSPLQKKKCCAGDVKVVASTTYLRKNLMHMIAYYCLLYVASFFVHAEFVRDAEMRNL
jgi:hypothetical protein